MVEIRGCHVVLGVITGAHGIRGEVKLKSFTEQPAAIADYGPLRSSTGAVIEIEALKPVKNGFTARLKGTTDRNQAEALRGVELWLERDRLPEPDEQEYYHADLIGLQAETATGESFGEVIAVQNYGAGDLLEIRRHDSGDTELFPFTAASVPTIEIAACRIVVMPPVAPQDEDES